MQKKNEHPMRQTPPDAPINEYYENISERLGIAQVILYLLLFAFTVVSLLANTGLITYQNFYYFFKDLNASAETVDVLHTDAVSYPADSDQSFTLYRKGVAIAGNASVTVFSSSGRQLLTENVLYQTPVTVGSGKYLLVYELGGTQYSLYNTYTCVYSGNTERPITGADISASGTYAIVTSSPEYNSVVEVYNSNFHLINRYSYQSYVCDVSVQAKGNAVAVLTTETAEGFYRTVLRIYEPGTANVIAEVEAEAGLALRCAYTSSGTLSVLTDTAISSYSGKGQPLNRIAFSGEELICADLGQEGAALVLKPAVASQKIHTIVFDKSGKIVYNERTEGTAASVSLASGTLYLLRQDGILRIRISSGATEFMEVPTADRVLLGVDENRFYLCTSKKAVCYRFG